MIRYFLDDRGFYCIRIAKEYSIKLLKDGGNVSFSRIDRQEDNVIGIYSKSVFGKNCNLSENDILKQLANIKHIGFEVTDSCNLDCLYCIYGKYYDSYDLRTNKKIDVEKSKKLIDYLIGAINSPRNINIQNNIFISFYGGEPLLNMEFIKEIVEYTQSKRLNNIVFHYMMTTNAIYLKKYFDFLLRYDFKLTISLDGSAENDEYRKFPNGKSSFDIVYNNIKFVQENYPDYFNRQIGFNAVLHKLNNYQEAFSFIYHEFGKVPILSAVNPAGVKPEMKKKFEEISTPKPVMIDDELDKEMQKALDVKSPDLSLLQRFVYVYSGNMFDDYNSLLAKKEQIRFIPTATCIPFSKRIFMTVNNKILPCERIGQQFYLGTVTDDGVNIDCQAIADKYNSYYDSLKSQCECCYSKQNCDECMFEIPGLGVNPKCQKFTDKDAFEKMLRKHIDFLAKKPESYRRVMTEILIVK